MRQFCLILLLLGLTSGHAPACINDSSTAVDEQQFVSGYDQSKRSYSALGQEVTRFDPTALVLLLPAAALIGMGVLWMRQEKRLAAKRHDASRPVEH